MGFLTCAGAPYLRVNYADQPRRRSASRPCATPPETIAMPFTYATGPLPAGWSYYSNGAIISFFIYFSSSLHLMPRGAVYISLVADAQGAVTACVATAMGGRKSQ